MNIKQILEFFDLKEVGQIKWSHRVNDKNLLTKSCLDSVIHFIEGDIILAEDGKVVMAHPPATDGDLEFTDWFKEIIKSKKGAKLDFKDPRAVMFCLNTIKKYEPNVPIILNADILIGPGSDQVAFNATEFINACQKNYPSGILSVGWTTKCDNSKIYTDKMIKEMLSVVKDIKSDITFPIRIFYLEKSYHNLKKLLKLPHSSLTLWNNEPVGPQTISWIKDNTSPENTFYDII
jgi:hypothetical protein